jgi:multimeric flavodoxin WrbA
MKAADAIVYAAPVHGFGLAGVMQRFIERAGVGFLRFDRPLTNRVGGAVVVGRRYSHENAYTQLMNNLMLNRMIMAGSGFPALLRAGGPQDLADDVEGLDSMYRMLDRMVEMCLMLRDANRPLAVPSTVEHRTGTLS